MGKYIKMFNTHTEYNNYITGSDKVLPNVSYCVDMYHVHYNPWVDNRVILTVNVNNTTNPTQILGSGALSSITKIEIDGVEQPTVVASYTFETTGDHIVKCTLADPTTIPDNFINWCDRIANFELPESITSIGNEAFGGPSQIFTTIRIPKNVASFGQYAFYPTGTVMKTFYLEPLVPPTVSGEWITGSYIEKIYVPAESLETYKTTTGWSVYASKIEANPN